MGLIDLLLLQQQLLLVNLVGLLCLLLIKGQALLVKANACLVCLCTLGDFLLLDLHQGVRSITARKRLLHVANFLHAHGNVDSDHAFALDSRDHTVWIGAVLLEQLDFHVLFRTQADVIQDVLLQLGSRRWAGLQNR